MSFSSTKPGMLRMHREQVSCSVEAVGFQHRCNVNWVHLPGLFCLNCSETERMVRESSDNRYVE